MANLGNAWHVPANPEPRGVSGMRDPTFPTEPTPSVSIMSGNQYQGQRNPGNQLQVGSGVFYRTANSAAWTEVPMTFLAAVANNKYYSAVIPTAGLAAGVVLEYYLRIAYDDHDTTFLLLGPDGMTSATAAAEADAQSAPFTFSIDLPSERGVWDPVFQLPNVGIHATVLASGMVLMWGRRDSPDESLDVDPPSPLHVGEPPGPPAQCTPFLLDPGTLKATATDKPPLQSGGNANLFCSGHTLLGDGRVLVAGGHLADGAGLTATTIYDPAANSWSASASMTHGRWYPSLTILPDGSVLVLSGSYRGPDGGTLNNEVPERWTGGTITGVAPPPNGAFDLYPRMHVASTGIVYITGSLQQTWSLDVLGGGGWSQVPTQRDNAQRDYAPSVLHDVDKVIYIGGGNAPTANTELLDLSQANPAWQPGTPMAFPRRQHNATILADGTVLVTGGTRSGGTVPPENFNNLDPGQPVHIAELWDPTSNTWTQLAAEATDRCYHATAVLLPDGRVLSAGSGEFFPIEGVQEENDPGDSHQDAQIFSPPYLFKGTRPVITSSPSAIGYAEKFQVGCDQPAGITKITWIRLSSVTHSFNGSQRFASLSFTVSGGGLQVDGPTNSNVCPPGSYMLFLIASSGVPSVAAIVKLAAPAAAATSPEVASALTAPEAVAPASDVLARHTETVAAARGTKVVVGLRGTCPYGIAACWGGAHEALAHLTDVDLVDPVPDADASTATVFLDGDGLPPIDDWLTEFHSVVNDSYTLLGFEVTLRGTVVVDRERLRLLGDGARPSVELVPLTQKVQMQRAPRVPTPPLPEELEAYDALFVKAASGPLQGIVTGPLRQIGDDAVVEVRQVDV